MAAAPATNCQPYGSDIEWKKDAATRTLCRGNTRVRKALAAEAREGAIGLRPAEARRLSRTVECRNYGRHFAADEMTRLLTLMADPPPLNRMHPMGTVSAVS